MLYLATGFVLGPWGLGFVHLDPMEHIAWFHHGAELAVTVSLFTVGLKLRLRPDAPALRPALFLAFGSMTITVALVATTPVVLLGWSWGAAILLGAIVAPTDPVLASDVRRRHFRDRDSARLTLTTDAGLNDGTTFPFVMLGLALLRGENPGSWWLALVGERRVLGGGIRTRHRRVGGLLLVLCDLGGPAGEPRRRLVSLTLGLVAVSILVHGLAVAPWHRARGREAR